MLIFLQVYCHTKLSHYVDSYSLAPHAPHSAIGRITSKEDQGSPNAPEITALTALSREFSTQKVTGNGGVAILKTEEKNQTVASLRE